MRTQAPALPAARRCELHRCAVRLETSTVAWSIIKAGVAVTISVIVSSVALAPRFPMNSPRSMVILTQTLVEPLGMLAYSRVVPRLVPQPLLSAT